MIRVVLALLLGLTSVAASGELYRWTDEDGRVHITDTPPPASAKNVRKSSAPRSPSAQAPDDLALAMKQFPVTLYTSPTCQEPCAAARATLNRRGVPFEEVEVWEDDTNAELLQVSGANEVPTLVVGRSVHRGFEQSAFDALLDSARYPKARVSPPRARK